MSGTPARLRDGGDRLDIGDDAARIGDRLDEDRLGLGRDGALEGPDIVGIGPYHVPAEILEGVIELVDRAAIELLGRDELLARLHQAVHHDHLRGMAGGDREPGGAALERRHPLLQHRRGRVADAGIDVAEGLQAEQRGRMVDVLEHERGGLIDRRRARAGGRDRAGRRRGSPRSQSQGCARSWGPPSSRWGWRIDRVRRWQCWCIEGLRASRRRQRRKRNREKADGEIAALPPELAEILHPLSRGRARSGCSAKARYRLRAAERP